MTVRWLPYLTLGVLLTYGLVRGPISNLQHSSAVSGLCFVWLLAFSSAVQCSRYLILMRLWRFVDALTVVCYSPFDTGARCNCDNNLYSVLWSHKPFGVYTGLDNHVISRRSEWWFWPFEVDQCASSGDLSWLQQCWHELKGNLMIVGLSVQTINFFSAHVYSTLC